MRKLFVFLPLVAALAVPSADADFGAHSAAICGAFVRSEKELRREIAAAYGERDIGVEYHSLERLREYAFLLETLSGRNVDEARLKLAAFLQRTHDPDYRTVGFTVGGEGGDAFLAGARANAAELGEIARKHKAISPWVIGFFGIRAVAGGITAYHLIENDLPVPLAVLAALAGAWKGSAVVKYLMRARNSPLEAFVRRESALATAKTSRVNLLSVVGRKALDYRIAKFVDGPKINPYSAEIVYETLPIGAPNVSRLFKLKSPVIRRRESRLDLIGLPNPRDPGKRLILVLLAEET